MTDTARKPIFISPHAAEQAHHRGASPADIEVAIRNGAREPVRQGRWQYRYNLEFNALWQGKHYGVKQVAPIVAEEPSKLVVVTVFVFYY